MRYGRRSGLLTEYLRKHAASAVDPRDARGAAAANDRLRRGIESSDLPEIEASLVPYLKRIQDMQARGEEIPPELVAEAEALSARYNAANAAVRRLYSRETGLSEPTIAGVLDDAADRQLPYPAVEQARSRATPTGAIAALKGSGLADVVPAALTGGGIFSALGSALPLVTRGRFKPGMKGSLKAGAVTGTLAGQLGHEFGKTRSEEDRLTDYRNQGKLGQYWLEKGLEASPSIALTLATGGSGKAVPQAVNAVSKLKTGAGAGLNALFTLVGFDDYWDWVNSRKALKDTADTLARDPAKRSSRLLGPEGAGAAQTVAREPGLPEHLAGYANFASNAERRGSWDPAEEGRLRELAEGTQYGAEKAGEIKQELDVLRSARGWNRPRTPAPKPVWRDSPGFKRRTKPAGAGSGQGG